MDNIKRPVYPFNVQPNAVDNIKVFNLDKSGQVSYLHDWSSAVVHSNFC